MKLVRQAKAFFSNPNSIIRALAIVAGGTAISQVLVMVSSPVLTRLYSPASFGVFTLYLSISQIILTVISFRYELAISLPKSNEDGGKILIFAIVLVILNAFGIGLLIYFGGDLLITSLNLQSLEPYLWLLPFALLGAGLYQALTFWAIRRKAYGIIARTTFAKTLTTLLGQIIAGLLGWSPQGLILGDFVGRFVGCGSLGKLSFDDNKEQMKSFSISTIYQQASAYRDFALFSTPATLVDRLALYLPSILLGFFFTPQVVGWFGLGQQVVGIPIAFVGQAVTQVYMGEASVFLREAPENLKGLYFKFSRNLFLLSILPILLLALTGPWLLGWFFGKDWVTAGSFIQVLAPMYIVQIVVSPLSQTLNLVGKQSWQLGWEIAQLVFKVGCMFVAWFLNLGAVGVVAAFSFASFVCYSALYLLSVYSLSISCRNPI